MEKAKRIESEKKVLRILSIVYLVLAVVGAVNLIAGFVSGDVNVAALTEQTQTSEGLVRSIVIVVSLFYALTVLVQAYMGWMGLRQSKGVETGTSHITVAKVCVGFLAIVLLVSIYSVVTSPTKDWIALCNSIVSVSIGVNYIRSASFLKG